MKQSIIKTPELGDRILFLSNFEVNGEHPKYEGTISRVIPCQNYTYIEAIGEHGGEWVDGRILENYGR